MQFNWIVQEPQYQRDILKLRTEQIKFSTQSIFDRARSPPLQQKKYFFLIKESRIGRDPPTSLSEKLKKNSFSLCLSQYHHTGAVKWSLEGFHFQLNHPMDLVSTMQNQSYFRWSLWSGVFLPFVKSLLRDDPLLANQSASPRPWANFEVLPVVAWLYRVL